MFGARHKVKNMLYHYVPKQLPGVSGGKVCQHGLQEKRRRGKRLWTVQQEEKQTEKPQK